MVEEKKHEDEKKRGTFTLNQRLTLIISFFGLLISIGGFYYVYKGLQSNDRAVSTNTYLQTYGWTLEIDKILTESPRIRPYLLDYNTAKLQLSADDSIKADAIADYMLDNFDAVLRNKSYFEIDSSAGRVWKETVAQYFKNSPLLCKAFSMDSLSYSQELRDAFHKK